MKWCTVWTPHAGNKSFATWAREYAAGEGWRGRAEAEGVDFRAHELRARPQRPYLHTFKKIRFLRKVDRPTSRGPIGHKDFHKGQITHRRQQTDTINGKGKPTVEREGKSGKWLRGFGTRRKWSCVREVHLTLRSVDSQLGLTEAHEDKGGCVRSPEGTPLSKSGIMRHLFFSWIPSEVAFRALGAI